MRIGVVRTVGSPCRCAESVVEGLRALNHEYLLVDSEEIELHASELAEKCELVIDHTDTYRGRGLYRSFVRLLLENCGARVVGASAKAGFVADNKAAAKERLAEAAIPVPPGIVIYSKSWMLPHWLRPPLVLKPAFEHMSRGLCVVETEQEARIEAARLLDTLRQPILMEAYIPGRELAVSILDGPNGPQALPILEWGIPSEGTKILTEGFKLQDPVDETQRAWRAGFSGNLEQELEAMARRAFQALDLQDYARFDVRLTPGGSPFFLEANTTPSLEPLEAFAVSANWAGLDYAALVERLLSAARNRYESSCPEETKLVRIQLPTGPIELQTARGVHFPPPSTIELAGLLDVREGEDALDLGCGSGLLSIAMAKLGARRVIATDLDSKALQATQINAVRNGVADRIEIRAGSWYEALGEDASREGQAGRFHVIVATPPQTPGHHYFGPKYGGPDGTDHLFKILRRAPDFLEPENGRLWLLAISLANPHALWDRLRDIFSEVALIRETDRPFKSEEYESMERGLFEYLLSLRSSGLSDFVEAENGGFAFKNLFIRAARPRKK
jgi:D-alanine-D-alanine ligase-like ATP-grasp enzyme/methylase of polypeptide subunit release factors